MSTDGKLPKHVQLSEMLIREIAAGKLADGARLPPERVFAAELGVAVGTLRKALAELTSKGLLQRIQGSGNYVRTRPSVKSIYSFLRLELAEGGGLPSATVIEVLKLNKPEDVAAIGTHPKAHRIRRIRTLNETPVALEEIWLDGRVNEAIRASDLKESLYLFYQTTFDLIISRVEDKVGVSAWPDWVPAGFPCTPNEPTGFVERVASDQSGTPVEYSRTWFDAGRARYVMRRN